MPDKPGSPSGPFDFLTELARHLNVPILAFGAIVIALLVLFGARLLPEWRPLIYIVAIGVMLIFLTQPILATLAERQAPPETGPRKLPGGDERPAQAPEEMPLLPEPKRPPSTAEARKNYLTSLVADCSRARLVGLDPSAADPARGGMSLERLYTSLDTLTLEEKEGKERRELPVLREETRKLSALKALATAEDKRMVLLGLPGSGKSTFVRYLALRQAQALLNPGFDLFTEMPEWTHGPCLPVIIPLGLFADSLPADLRRGNAGHIEGYLQKTLDSDDGTKGLAPALLEEVKRGGVVLFDGLDEVADLKKRPIVRQAVEALAHSYPAARCLVTCRTYSYTDPDWQLTGWVMHTLAPLDPEKIEYFVNAWYAELKRIDPGRKDDYERKRQTLHPALKREDRRRLAEISDNPLMLTIMAVVHTHKGELPDTRAQVYKECVEHLLIRWEAERSVTRPEKSRPTILQALELSNDTPLIRALQNVAFNAREGESLEIRERRDGGSITVVTETILRGVMGFWLKEGKKVDTFLFYCESANGLLALRGTAPLPGRPSDAEAEKVYAFPHSTFEEYLAARHLSTLSPLDQLVRERIHRGDRWREVLVFLGEYQCFEIKDSGLTEALLDRLVPEAAPGEPTDADWLTVWLAGDLLALIRRANGGPAFHEKLDSRVVKRLAQMVETPGALVPIQRAPAGRTLSILGDPRPGISILPSPPGRGDENEVPDLRWAAIPGGTLNMGSAKGEKFQTPYGGEEPYDDEYGPQSKPFPVQIRPFQLAAYSITVAQFRPFVGSDGYSNPDYWTKTGWAWRARGSVSAPHEWDDTAWHLDNHPISYISWYEAVAYCNWLTSQLRATGGIGPSETIRLPTEAEWEWAARGPEGLRWPWGNELQENACNSTEAGLNRTTAVGLFPQGRNWTGQADPANAVYDLAGNVWEWCSTKWAKSYAEDWQERSLRNEWAEIYLEGDDFRVLRGGSFVQSRGRPRCGPPRGSARAAGAGSAGFGWRRPHSSLNSEVSGLWDSGISVSLGDGVRGRGIAPSPANYFWRRMYDQNRDANLYPHV